MIKKWKLLHILVLFGIVAFLAVSGCTDNNSKNIDNASPIDSAPTSETLDSSSIPTASGEVVETMNSGGYTYVKIDTGNGEVWAAGSETVVKVGDNVAVSGYVMYDFSSSSLNRTFAEIIFTDAIQNTSEKQVESPSFSELKANPDSYYIVKLTGIINQTLDAGGYTYVELSDGTENIWVAISAASLTKGDSLTATGTVNTEFPSSSLNRTFDVLVLGANSAAATGSGSTSPHGAFQ